MTSKKSPAKFTLPAVRRVYSSLLASDIVSVQPMDVASVMGATIRELPNCGPFCLGQRLNWRQSVNWKFFTLGKDLVVTKIEETKMGLQDWFYEADFTPKQYGHIHITCVAEDTPEPYRVTYAELKNAFFPEYEGKKDTTETPK